MEGWGEGRERVGKEGFRSRVGTYRPGVHYVWITTGVSACVHQCW